MIKILEKCLISKVQSPHVLKCYKVSYKNYSHSHSHVLKYCNILKVRENSSKEEIKEAYYKLVKLHHPDRQSLIKRENFDLNKTNHKEISFLEIQHAYEELLNLTQDKDKGSHVIPNDHENKIDEIIEDIIYAGISTKSDMKKDLRKNLQPDTIFYPLYGIKLDKEDLRSLKNIVKRINHKNYLKKIKREEIKKQNEKMNINIYNLNKDGINNVEKNYQSEGLVLREEACINTIPLSSEIFLKITKIITLTGISYFFLIHFGIYVGTGISLYVIYLAIT